LGRQNNVVKVDVSNEQRPVVVGEGNLGVGNPDHGQVTPMGNLIFIGNDHGTGSAFFCHQRGRDTIPPTVGATYPKDGSTHVNTEARVNVVISDHVNIDTIDAASVIVRAVGGEALEGIYTYSFNTISFGPNQPLQTDTTYELVLPAGGLADVMGNQLTDEVLVRFSTGAEIVIPPIVDDPDPLGAAGSGQGGSSPNDGEPGAGGQNAGDQGTGGQYTAAGGQSHTPTGAAGSTSGPAGSPPVTMQKPPTPSATSVASSPSSSPVAALPTSTMPITPSGLGSSPGNFVGDSNPFATPSATVAEPSTSGSSGACSAVPSPGDRWRSRLDLGLLGLALLVFRRRRG
jgi:hypothetical protein